jgi:hypothetical protein
MPDAQRQGKRWFCSPSCLLRAESNLSVGKGRKARGRAGALRRVVRWTLILVGVLVVLAVVGAFIGSGKSPKKPTTRTLGVRSASRRAIPLGKAAAVGGGWYLRIKSVNWNAAKAIAAVPGQYPHSVPRQAREVMPTVTYSYRGGGQSDVRIDFANRVFAVGRHKAPYSWDSGLNACGPGEAKLPPPDAQTKVGIGGSSVFSGTSISGHICFEVAANDVSTLRLYVKPPETYPPNKKPPVYFALR